MSGEPDQKQRRGRWVRRLRWPAVGVLGLGAGLVAIVLTQRSCTSFPRDWDQAGGMDVAPEELLAGRWEGRWESGAGLGGDDLRCVIRKLDGGKYEAKFHADYAFGLTFDSTVVLEVQKRSGRWRFKGRKDLGFLYGGVYQYEGTSDGEEFSCRYQSSMDHGRFEMTRVTEQGAEQ